MVHAHHRALHKCHLGRHKSRWRYLQGYAGRPTTKERSGSCDDHSSQLHKFAHIFKLAKVPSFTSKPAAFPNRAIFCGLSTR